LTIVRVLCVLKKIKTRFLNKQTESEAF